MKKVILVLLFAITLIPSIIFADDKELNMYLFHGDGCPHCAALIEYLDGFLKEHDNVKLYKYEIWQNDENLKKFGEVQKILNQKSSGIPYLVIGETTIVGFSEEYTPERIRNAVKYYSEVKYKDDVGVYLGVVKEEKEEKGTSRKEKYIDSDVTIPIIGKKNAKDVSLLLSSIVIGLVDGFNPCAMWILLFLISMLLGLKNKKRKWILGITFLFTSALVYFLFLISWLNLAMFLNKIAYIRAGIAFIACVFGAYSVIRFINTKNDDGCEVVDSKNRKRIIKSIKKIVKEKSFILAIIGIILLAISVNISY